MKTNAKRFLPLVVFLVMALGAWTVGCDDDDDDDNDDNDDAAAVDYAVVDTDQTTCYDTQNPISCGDAYAGQDAQYDGRQASYEDNGDGTVTDLITGLMWQQDPGDKVTYGQAVAGADDFELAGYDDWRLPTIKELYSLILFTGEDPSGEDGNDTSGLTPFINHAYFHFAYGDTDAGERVIDSQWATRSVYGSTVMDGNECFFGVNFADGRIKCYPTSNKTYFTIYVRGGEGYGTNDLTDNGDGTVTDHATGLVWQQGDNGAGVMWQDALDYCESLNLAGHDDWRLPNAKELESIVDYDRAPDTTGSAAIDPVFETSTITNEGGEKDYPYYWTGTTHTMSNGMGADAAYLAFGRALGYMNGHWTDVHGAGAQRSDPKFGDPADYPQGHGPQGDAIRIYNYARCVRAGEATPAAGDEVAGDDDDTAPPDEAVDACDGKTEGDACSFEGLGGDTINGTCEYLGDILACVP